MFSNPRPPLLIAGATGFIGGHLLPVLAREYEVTALYHQAPPLPVEGVKWVHRGDQPSGIAVVNAAAVSSISECDADPELAEQVNKWAAMHLAERAGGPMIHLSTDQVFDGTAAPYRDEDQPTPISTYGKTKQGGEEMVHDANPEALVLRLNLVYGRSLSGSPSATDRMVAAARKQEICRLFTDEYRSPIYVEDVAHAIRDLLRRPVFPDCTTLHLGGPERLSRYELGEAILRHHGLEQMAMRSTLAEYTGPPRAPDTSFDSRRTYQLLGRPPRTITKVLAEGGRV